MNKDKHHWEGEVADPDKYFGFIYLIECLIDNTKYIGKKQYWAAKRGATGCKSRIPDKSSPRWKDSCWIESDWRSYTGSSKDFNAHIKKHGKHRFVFTILGQCAGKGALHYAEVEEQVARDVLRAKLPNGEYEYFNRQIAAVKFRPKRESTPCSEKLREFMLSDKNPVKQGRDWRYGKTSEEIAEIIERRSSKLRGRKKKPLTSGTRDKISKAAKKNFVGLGNPRSDRSVYMFEHKDGRLFEGTRQDLRDAYGLSVSDTCDLLHKPCSRKGWKIKESTVED